MVHIASVAKKSARQFPLNHLPLWLLQTFPITYQAREKQEWGSVYFPASCSFGLKRKIRQMMIRIETTPVMMIPKPLAFTPSV